MDRVGRTLGRTLILVCCAVLTAAASSAQSIAIGEGRISIRNSLGDWVWQADENGNILAGGPPNCATLLLMDDDGTPTVDHDACNGDLILGGPGEDGDIRVRGLDGVSTTVAVDGATALITLGSSTEDGDLRLFGGGSATIELDGGTGNATQELDGNGFVKAWARIASDGSVTSCYKCNPVSSQTRRLDDGVYEVSFSHLASDITMRPRLAVLDVHAAGSVGIQFTTSGSIGLANRLGDATSVYVRTEDDAGDPADKPFTLLIF